jgi:hypothetical protein
MRSIARGHGRGKGRGFERTGFTEAYKLAQVDANRKEARYGKEENSCGCPAVVQHPSVHEAEV